MTINPLENARTAEAILNNNAHDTLHKLTNLAISTAQNRGGLQIAATRGGIFDSIRIGTAGTRTDVRIENRQQHYIGASPVSQFRIAQVGYYLKNDATGENSIGNDYTWEVAIEGTNPSMTQELFTFGTNICNISGSQKIPLVMTDPAFNINIPAGGSFWLRQAVAVTTATLAIPTSSQAASATDGGFISPSVASQVNTTGTMTAPSGGVAFGGPGAVVLGIPSSPQVAVLMIGDSIGNGTGDTVDTFGNLGFLARGLSSVNGFPIPWARTTVGGDEFAQTLLNISPRKRALWQYATHIIIELGTNDINSNAATLTQLQTFVTNLCTDIKAVIGPYGKPPRTALVTLLPRVTTTDSYATAANQTPVAGFTVGGTRDLYNSWLLSNAGTSLIDYVIDANPFIEDQVNRGKWITNGAANFPTTDGIHPTSALHILAAQAVNSWALGISAP